MVDVVNLRLARKARKRTVKDRTAEANRAKFGQAKAAKALSQAEDARAARALDGARREPD